MVYVVAVHPFVLAFATNSDLPTFLQKGSCIFSVKSCINCVVCWSFKVLYQFLWGVTYVCICKVLVDFSKRNHWILVSMRAWREVPFLVRQCTSSLTVARSYSFISWNQDCPNLMIQCSVQPLHVEALTACHLAKRHDDEHKLCGREREAIQGTEMWEIFSW